MTPSRPGRRSDAGFSLVEALVATGILATALVALAQLFAVATRTNVVARTSTMTAILAQQKMEQLRGLAWTALSPSPAGTLGRNVGGYVDYLDVSGSSLGGGSVPPAGTAYVRRWAIEPLPANPENALVLQLSVTRLVDRDARDAADRGPLVRRPGEARLVNLRTRKGP